MQSDKFFEALLKSGDGPSPFLPEFSPGNNDATDLTVLLSQFDAESSLCSDSGMLNHHSLLFVNFHCPNSCMHLVAKIGGGAYLSTNVNKIEAFSSSNMYSSFEPPLKNLPICDFCQVIPTDVCLVEGILFSAITHPQISFIN